MTKRAWLTQDAIPARRTVAISLPDDEQWRAQFLGALLLLTGAENWELFGELTPEQMAVEWLDIWVQFSGGQTTMLPIGTVLEFGGEELPEDFIWAHGQDVSRETYASLFAVFGTRYGVGDGSTTFGVVDKRQRVGVGMDEEMGWCNVLGETGGQAEVILNLSEIPTHNHAMAAHSHTQVPHTHIQNAHNHTQNWFQNTGGAGWEGNGATWVPAGGLAGVSSVTPTNQNATPTINSAQPTIGDSGGGGSHPNLQPYIAMNYIIKYR